VLGGQQPPAGVRTPQGGEGVEVHRRGSLPDGRAAVDGEIGVSGCCAVATRQSAGVEQCRGARNVDDALIPAFELVRVGAALDQGPLRVRHVETAQVQRAQDRPTQGGTPALGFGGGALGLGGGAGGQLRAHGLFLVHDSPEQHDDLRRQRQLRPVAPAAQATLGDPELQPEDARGQAPELRHDAGVAFGRR
jgi:hypothetical protein